MGFNPFDLFKDDDMGGHDARRNFDAVQKKIKKEKARTDNTAIQKLENERGILRQAKSNFDKAKGSKQFMQSSLLFSHQFEKSAGKIDTILSEISQRSSKETPDIRGQTSGSELLGAISSTEESVFSALV